MSALAWAQRMFIDARCNPDPRKFKPQAGAPNFHRSLLKLSDIADHDPNGRQAITWIQGNR